MLEFGTSFRRRHDFGQTAKKGVRTVRRRFVSPGRRSPLRGESGVRNSMVCDEPAVFSSRDARNTERFRFSMEEGRLLLRTI